MSIAFDNASSAKGAAVATIKWIHTAQANVVAVMALYSPGANSASSAGLNNVAMTNMGIVKRTSGAQWMTIYTGSATSAGNLSCSATLGGSDTWPVGMVTYTGAADNAFGTGLSTQTASGATNVNLSVSTHAGQTVVTFMAMSVAASAVASNGTQRLNVSSGSSYTLFGWDLPSGGNTTSFSVSLAASSVVLAGLGISASAVSVSSPPAIVPYSLRLLGVGL